ncbi:unnamed protein product [Prorocentrum cordatum]|uniref:Uncharacterized protein n=1 Tax=Prorocentrum cordatum TaxID=2364126 RepID=A0ABN9V8B1_9DINO|nr:unnamed protein product [Polarella glacialis]
MEEAERRQKGEVQRRETKLEALGAQNMIEPGLDRTSWRAQRTRGPYIACRAREAHGASRPASRCNLLCLMAEGGDGEEGAGRGLEEQKGKEVRGAVLPSRSWPGLEQQPLEAAGGGPLAIATKLPNDASLHLSTPSVHQACSISLARGWRRPLYQRPREAQSDRHR